MWHAVVFVGLAEGDSVCPGAATDMMYGWLHITGGWWQLTTGSGCGNNRMYCRQAEG
jgi:hypothetical protein